MVVTVGVSSSLIAGAGVPDLDGIRFVGDYGPENAEIIWRRHGDSTADLIAAVARRNAVRWVHLDTVGVDRLPLESWRARGITVTNGRGLSTVRVAEWTLSAMLLAVRRLHEIVRLSDAQRWEAPENPIGTLAGGRVVILGLGSIGQRVAQLARPFGAILHGIVSSEPKMTDPRRALVDTLGSPATFATACRDADFLVLCAPLTDATRGIVSSRVLAELRDTAWVINAARGELVDERGLAEAVGTRRLGGAVLDVVSTEPLPAESPLWSHTNIVLSAHLADRPRADDSAAAQLFLAEMDRYLRSERLQNEVDLAKGY